MKRKIQAKTFIALIAAGACLWSTANADQVYRVSPGDTLTGIARKNGITADMLWTYNPYIRDPDWIYSGQILIIPENQEFLYTVESGDTLAQIAQRFEIPLDALTERNRLASPNQLYMGQKLKIPAVYIVKLGDTLYRIARSFGTSVQDLAEKNKLSSPDVLHVGQPLVLPPRPKVRESQADFDNQLSPITAKFPDAFFYKGTSEKRQIALTFDDGPAGTYTAQILDLLKLHDVPATFFLLGSNVEGQQNLVKRIVAEGHTVASHSWDHPDLRTLSPEGLTEQIVRSEQAIQNAAGVRTALLRPPYGFFTDETLQRLKQLGYAAINWSVDSNDWRDTDENKVLINTMPEINNGAIILFHDAYAYATAPGALGALIETLKGQGFTFVTVDALLGIPAYQ